MKKILLIIFCILYCLFLPAGAVNSLTATLSIGTGSPEMPPQNASVYISEAKEAVADRNWTNALLISTRGTTWYPENADLLCLKGYSLRKMGQYDRSVEVVSNAIRLDPKPVRYANRGYAFLALGKDSAALADADTGILLNANYPSTYGVKALALNGMRRNTEALAAIEQALVLEPENAHYWQVKGITLASSGNCADAREALERSLVLDRNYALPYPGFASAEESLLSLNTTCQPAATPATAGPSPTKSPAGAEVAVPGLIGALFIVMMRR